MKKGLIGPFQLGALNGMAGTMKIAETVTHQTGANLEGIFYATAFHVRNNHLSLNGYNLQQSPSNLLHCILQNKSHRIHPSLAGCSLPKPS